MATLINRDASLFLLVFAALLVRLMLAPPIWHHGEAREGLVVQGIVQNHQWILPLRNGELPSKPPLFHWIAALCVFLGGLSDFTVRLPSVIGAGVMTVATFMLGKAAGDRRTGWLAVGALLGMYEFWNSASQARVDMVFSACITASVGGFFFWYRDRHNVSRIVCYMACAGAVLAKGPAGFVLPVLIIVAFLTLERQLRLFRTFWSWPLAASVLIIDMGWYGLAYQSGGNHFIEVQLKRENVDRALGIGNFGDHSYLAMAAWLGLNLLPWNMGLLGSLIRRIRGERADSVERLLHIWWVAIFLVFSLAAGKRAVYLLPIYPAVAVVAARRLGEIILRPRPSGYLEDSKQAMLIHEPAARHYNIVKAGAVIVVLIDLAVMLTNRHISSELKPRQARLAFIENVRALMPAGRQLFATPQIDNTEIIVIAYRLAREIERKPLTCGDRNDIFVSALEDSNSRGIETRVLASSEIQGLSLITLLSEKPAQQNSACIGKSPSI